MLRPTIPYASLGLGRTKGRVIGMAKAKEKATEKASDRPTHKPDDTIGPLMIEAWQIKQQLNKAIPDEQYDPAQHIARRYEELKVLLGEAQAEQDAGELRYGQLKFRARLQAGRASLNRGELSNQLLAYGLDAQQIQDVFAASTTEGDPFWVREIEMVKEKEK